MERFSIDSCVRGYHVYNDIWEASVDEELPCQCEDGNSADPCAVAIKRSGVVVGHIPRRMSSVCSLFLRRNGLMKIRTTGGRRYSADLPQGGLEIPCTITFEGVKKDVQKVKKLIIAALTPPDTTKSSREDLPPDNKKRRINPVKSESDSGMEEWVRSDGLVLTQYDKNILVTGQMLSDKHIDFAHTLL